jgi:hypothetical protein
MTAINEHLILRAVDRSVLETAEAFIRFRPVSRAE